MKIKNHDSFAVGVASWVQDIAGRGSATGVAIPVSLDVYGERRYS
ncbi:MAG: hypothetical protein OXE87_01915 [Chloroflexi bacterium]|nr:hypothetical protein [Chloroflexota bacterium]